MLLTQSMSMGEKFLSTLSITILGMVVVYIVLVIIAYSLKLLKIIFSEKPKETLVEAEKILEVKGEETEETVHISKDDDIDLIVLLTAAIAAFEGTSGENLIVRNIRELPQNKSTWAAAGRHQLMSANNITRTRR